MLFPLTFVRLGPGGIPDVLEVLQVLIVFEARHLEELSRLTHRRHLDRPRLRRAELRHRVGVRLVGTVLNRRRNYIPPFIEEML